MMNKVTTQDKKASFASIILLVYIFTVLYTPLTAFSWYRVTRLLPLAWIVCTACANPSFYKRMGRWDLALLFFSSYSITVPLLFDVTIIANRYYDLFGMPFMYLAYRFHRERKEDMRLLVKFLFIFVIYTTITSIIVLYSDPFAARHGLSSYFEGVGSSSNALVFCGNYDFSYMMVLANLCLFYCLRYHPTILGFCNRRILFMFFILICVFIVMTNFLTALICTALGVFIILMGKRVNLSAVILALIVLGVFLVFKDQILSALIGLGVQNLGEGLTQSRMESIMTSGGIGEAELYESRSDLYFLGLKGFLSHPFWGNFYTMRYVDGYLYGEISQHSTILDTFTLFGLLAGLLYLYIIYKPLVMRFKLTHDSMTLCMILVFTALVGFDNATPGLGIAVYFIYMYSYDKLIAKDSHKSLVGQVAQG